MSESNQMRDKDIAHVRQNPSFHYLLKILLMTKTIALEVDLGIFNDLSMRKKQEDEKTFSSLVAFGG